MVIYKVAVAQVGCATDSLSVSLFLQPPKNVTAWIGPRELQLHVLIGRKAQVG